MSGSSHTRRDSEVKKGDGNTSQHALSNAGQGATPTKSHTTPVRKSSLKPLSKSSSPKQKKHVPSVSHSGKGVKIEEKVRVILDHSDSESGSPSEKGTEKSEKAEKRTVYNEKDRQNLNSRVKSTSGKAQSHRDKEHAPLEISRENIRKKLSGDLQDYMCLFFAESSPGQVSNGQYLEMFCHTSWKKCIFPDCSMSSYPTPILYILPDTEPELSFLAFHSMILFTVFTHLLYNHNETKTDHWHAEVQQLVEKKIREVTPEAAGSELLKSQIDEWAQRLDAWEDKKIITNNQPDDWLTKMVELSNTRSFEKVKSILQSGSLRYYLGLLFKYEKGMRDNYVFVKAKPVILRPRPDRWADCIFGKCNKMTDENIPSVKLYRFFKDQQELLNALAFVLHKKIVEAVLDHYYRYHRKQANGNQKELAAALQANAKKAETKLKDMHIDSKLLGEKWVYINEIEDLTVEDIENMGIEFEDPHKQEIRVSVLKKNGIRVKKVSDKDSE